MISLSRLIKLEAAGRHNHLTVGYAQAGAR
jgi:hypothetical protein